MQRGYRLRRRRRQHISYASPETMSDFRMFAAGFRILFSGSENFETSNVEVLSVEYASAVMETMFNPTGTEMVGQCAMDKPGLIVQVVRATKLLTSVLFLGLENSSLHMRLWTSMVGLSPPTVVLSC